MGANLNKIFVADAEATCWSSEAEQGKQPNEIIEIGMCEVNLKTRTVENKKSFVVRPHFSKVSSFCTALTGWTQEQINEGDDIRDVLGFIKDYYRITNNHVWASYGEYDRVKLSSSSVNKGNLLGLYGIAREDNPFAMMRSHLNIKTLMAMKEGLKKEIGMARALAYYKLPLEGRHHNGADDAFNIGKIFLKVL